MDEQQQRRDPILLLEALLKSTGFADDASIESERTAAQVLINTAVAFAEVSDLPDPSEAMRYVFTEVDEELQ